MAFTECIRRTTYHPSPTTLPGSYSAIPRNALSIGNHPRLWQKSKAGEDGHSHHSSLACSVLLSTNPGSAIPDSYRIELEPRGFESQSGHVDQFGTRAVIVT